MFGLSGFGLGPTFFKGGAQRAFAKKNGIPSPVEFVYIKYITWNPVDHVTAIGSMIRVFTSTLTAGKAMCNLCINHSLYMCILKYVTSKIN